MATDHLSIDDATYDDLRKHFSKSQIVELGFLCAVCVGSAACERRRTWARSCPSGSRSVTA